MKKNLFIIAVLFCFFSGIQAQSPAPSPAASITQTIGTTEFTIAYSRPSMKGRAIFGELVPYDKVWRTGANLATKLTIGKDVTIEGKALKAGTYALFSTPGKASWKIHFHTYDQSYPNTYDGKTPLLSVDVTPATMSDKVESFMFVFENLKDKSGELGILWDNIYVPIKIGVN
jgi:hypothetical protein